MSHSAHDINVIVWKRGLGLTLESHLPRLISPALALLPISAIRHALFRLQTSWLLPPFLDLTSQTILRTHLITPIMPPRKRKAEATSDENEQPRKAARLTRSMTTEAARKAVFNTTELLERIILHVPPIKIFAIQRVCKQFHNLIQSSTPIQQRMFLKSSKKPRFWKIRRPDGKYVGGNRDDISKTMVEEDLELLPCTDEENTALTVSSESLSSGKLRRITRLQATNRSLICHLS